MPKPFRTIIGKKVYSASYEVDGNILIVTGKHGTKRAVIGVSKPPMLAKALLRAMIRRATKNAVEVTTVTFVQRARLRAAQALNHSVS